MILQNLMLFKIELKKLFLSEIRYFMNFLSDLIVYYILFLGLYFFIRYNGNLSSAELNNTINMQLIGYLSWFFFSFTITFSTNTLSSETTQGTFEQLCINSNSMVKIFLIKLLVVSIRNIVLILPLTVLLVLSTGVKIVIGFNAILIFLIMLIGIFGLSLILAGFEVYYKKIGQFPFILSILLLGSSIIDTSGLPKIFQNILYTLPFTRGTDLMKFSISKKYVITNHDILLISVNSMVYILLGLICFYYFFNKAKEKGNLSKF